MKYAIKMKPYYIDEIMYWSNKYGWTSNLNEADLFSYEETICLRLPIDGEWYKLDN